MNSKTSGNHGISRSNGIGQFFSTLAAMWFSGGRGELCNYAADHAAERNARQRDMEKTRGQL